MNSSAGDVADVPAGVVTVTSTVPVPAGLSTVIFVSLTTTTSARRRNRAEVHLRCAGEAAAGDRHHRAAGHRTGCSGSRP